MSGEHLETMSVVPPEIHEVAPTEPVVPMSAIVEWLAETDSSLAAALASLEKEEPDRFTSKEDQIAHISQLAILAGKREILEDIVLRLRDRQTPQAS